VEPVSNIPFPSRPYSRFLIYGGLIYTISRVLRICKVDIIKIVLFFMFIWNTIDLLGFITETLAIYLKIEFFFYV